MTLREHELLLYNGRIYPQSSAAVAAEAILLRGERIVAVGRLRDMPSPGTGPRDVLDLRGRCVLPGFVDAHVHLLSLGLFRRRVQLGGCGSLEECLNRIQQAVKKIRPGEWVLGGGWDQELRVTGALTAETLDRLAPENPVALDSKDLHSSWVNTAALRAAGMKPGWPEPPGGRIERDRQGRPTGILQENAVTNLRAIADNPTSEVCLSSVEDAIAELQQLGITGVHVPEDARTWRALQALRAEERLDLRVYMLPPVSRLPHIASLGLQTGFGDDRLRLGAVKVFADGSLGSQTAALLKPYRGSRDRGVVVTPHNQVVRLGRTAADAGVALAIHAIGDRAVRSALDALEAARAVERDHRLRHRIEHVQLVDPKDLPRFSDLGVLASVQPLHAVADRDLAERMWGRRCAYAYPYRSLLDAGTMLAAGSDAPVESPNPLLGIRAAVTRRQSNSEPPWHPEQCLTVPEAVRAYTYGGAYASGEELIKGTLMPGMLADLTILSDDIFSVSEDDIGGLEVDGTIVAGEVRWQREGTV